MMAVSSAAPLLRKLGTNTQTISRMLASVSISASPPVNEISRISLVRKASEKRLSGGIATQNPYTLQCVANSRDRISLSSYMQKTEYVLPTLHNLEKKTILDPLLSQILYKLPTRTGIVKEKVDPAYETVVQKESPPRERGTHIVRIECMPWLMRIRHRKMKKHKLKKFRKRMIFLHRKLAEIKKKKKEKVLQEYEAFQMKCGADFDAEKFVESEIKLAKEGGWKVDVVKSRKSPTQAGSQSG